MKSFRSKRVRAFTLIEVVVGLTLMASVLVGSLLALSAHRKQRRTADAKLVAVRFADDLMNRFFSLSEGIPLAARGVVPGQPGWMWRTSLVGSAAPAGIPLQVVRVEVLDQSTSAGERTLVSIEVVQGLNR